MNNKKKLWYQRRRRLWEILEAGTVLVLKGDLMLLEGDHVITPRNESPMPTPSKSDRACI